MKHELPRGLAPGRSGVAQPPADLSTVRTLCVLLTVEDPHPDPDDPLTVEWLAPLLKGAKVTTLRRTSLRPTVEEVEGFVCGPGCDGEHQVAPEEDECM